MPLSAIFHYVTLPGGAPELGKQSIVLRSTGNGKINHDSNLGLFWKAKKDPGQGCIEFMEGDKIPGADTLSDS